MTRGKQRLWMGGLLCAAALVAAAVALDGPGGPSRAAPPARPAADALPSAGLRLTCDESASPALAEVVAGRDLVVGPLVLVAYRVNENEAPPRNRRGDPDRAYAWKLPLSVKAGARVTVAVPRRLRREAALAFRATQLTTSRLRDGDGAIRFDACPRSDDAAYTGWPGRVLATRPLCLPLRVTEARAPTRVARVSLGAGRCSATSARLAR